MSLIDDLIKLGSTQPIVDIPSSMSIPCDSSFIVPIIQGYIKAEFVNIDLINIKSNDGLGSSIDDTVDLIEYKTLKFCLISRRSRFRLGNY